MATYHELADMSNEEKRLYQPDKLIRERAYITSLQQYEAMYRESIENPKAFWTKIADTFYWKSKWQDFQTSNYDRTKGPVNISWFKGGITNICFNVLDRHVENGQGDRVAFFWEGNKPNEETTITYSQLLARVKRVANALKSLGVKKGNTIALYQPMILDLVVAMLACARIGAPHSIVFGGFSAEALADRIIDAGSHVIFTADGSFRGTKFVDLKGITDEAVKLCKERGFEVEHVLVSRNVKEDAPVPIELSSPRDKWLDEIEATAEEECEPEWVDAEHMLFLLYTSGSTGRPKGVVHTHGGYMVWAATTHKYSFDYHPDDVYWCTADIGWITGHSYITYGPLANCATSVIFEGTPFYPNAGRFWEIVERYRVTSFYTAPTAIRALMRQGPEYPVKYDLSSLRVLGTVGEPINPEAWMWYYEVVGQKRCSIVDTWWQTETGGHMITGLPGTTPMKPGSASLPFFGVVPAIVNNEGKELQGTCEGYLVIKQPWPGQMRTVFGDHARFEVTYFAQFNGYYCTGDGARRDEHGYYWITGRTDDVINVSGHRLGTAELESALAKHDAVAEAAVVGFPHEIKGEGIYCFIVLKGEGELNKQLVGELKQHVRQHIGPFAQPDQIQQAPGLPKTRSGKVMRRILRKIASKEEGSLGDTSTLADPSVIDKIIEARVH
eukprot:gene5429-8894_t